MKIIETNLSGCFLIEPNLFHDERGYFMESFNEKKFNEALNTSVHFVQDNQSVSTKGVLRGLHYQIGGHAQAKLVRVLDGSVLDIALDIRPNSPTYGQHFSIELSSQNQKQLFVPRGFAHGFLVLSERATFFYKCDNYYHKESEAGIKFDDPSLNINWNFSREQLIVSEKDILQPLFENAPSIW
jgi:dTDP-4-dehydrorhamnose 3,5-epimerase